MAYSRWIRNYGLISAAGISLVLGLYSGSAVSAEEEPIAYIGHGAFFDARGKQIEPTSEFLQKAERWYEKKLLSTQARSAEFEGKARDVTRGLDLSPYERLFARQAVLSWMASNATPDSVSGETLGKLRALEYRMRRTLSQKGMKALFNTGGEPVNLQLLRRIDALPRAKALALKILRAGEAAPGSGVRDGKDYVDDCAAAGVPIPPPIGRMAAPGVEGWKVEGMLPTASQFIVGTPAELRSYENAQGMCYALPRYEDESMSQVSLDGVVCLSKTTGKSCFWDNQMNKLGFSFAPGTVIPIGYPDLAVNSDGLYQAGGAELEQGSGGVCTSCHAGENPFIVHPRLELRPGFTWGRLQNSMPAFAPVRFTPMVPASWPQNEASAPDDMVPAGCAGCHSPDGEKGRLPALSPALRGYCFTILPQALEKTMPPNSPGSQVGKADVQAYIALCGPPPEDGR